MLVFIAGVGDFRLRVTAFDRRNHPPHGVDVADVLERPFLHLGREGFYKIAAAERIGHRGYATFMSDDLLRSQSNGDRVFAGQGVGLIQ